MADTYSRIYHRLMTEFPSVYRSDSQLALFVRLLVAADKFYPEWPTANRRNGAYQSLLKAGLVIEQEGVDGYTIRGLRAERERKTNAARIAAASRWGMPNKTVTEQNKNSANGDAPAIFMGYRPKAREHFGQHPDCHICAPLRPQGNEVTHDR